MFTGLVECQGRVVARAMEHEEISLSIESPLGEVACGDSIACSGVCLTVVDRHPPLLSVQVSAHTQRCTTVPSWKEGTTLNLERALKVGDRLGGHFVLGHVDGPTSVLERTSRGGSIGLLFSKPKTRHITPQGCVTVDGVSLTVTAVSSSTFSVNIVPHTAAVTTLGQVQEGEEVNLEFDLLSRYIHSNL